MDYYFHLPVDAKERWSWFYTEDFTAFADLYRLRGA